MKEQEKYREEETQKKRKKERGGGAKKKKKKKKKEEEKKKNILLIPLTCRVAILVQLIPEEDSLSARKSKPTTLSLVGGSSCTRIRTQGHAHTIPFMLTVGLGMLFLEGAAGAAPGGGGPKPDSNKID